MFGFVFFVEVGADKEKSINLIALPFNCKKPLRARN